MTDEPSPPPDVLSTGFFDGPCPCGGAHAAREGILRGLDVATGRFSAPSPRPEGSP